MNLLSVQTPPGSTLYTLDALKQYTNIVADTPEYDRIAPYKPTDITTNPTNILAASRQPRFAWIVDEALDCSRFFDNNTSSDTDLEDQVTAVYRQLLLRFGRLVHSRITGFVSTQIDPSLALDTQGTVAEACKLIDMYRALGVPKERVMIKVPATWEGLQAVRILEQPAHHDIRCTLTLVQSVAQATLAAEVGATMVSPFVGRVLDWWHHHYPDEDYSGPKDPGVKLCKEIEALYRLRGYKTKIMAAVRTVDECVHLAGIDAMTLNPGLLEQLRTTRYKVERYVVPEEKNNGMYSSLIFRSC